MFSLRLHQLTIRLVDTTEIPTALDFIRRARFRIVQFSATTLTVPANDYIIAGAWHQKRLAAVLVAIRVNHKIAWIRACALEGIVISDHDATVRALAQLLVAHAPVASLFYSGDNYDAWLAHLLRLEGFVAHGEIVTFVATHTDVTPYVSQAHIRPLVMDDVAAVQYIDSCVFDAQWQKSPFEVQELFLGDGIRIAAVIDERTVGYAIALWHDQHTILHLVRIAVHPNHQRQGIARHLLTQVMHYAHQSHAHKITLNTQHDNHGAHALYVDLGFQRGIDTYHVITQDTSYSLDEHKNENCYTN